MVVWPAAVSSVARLWCHGGVAGGGQARWASGGMVAWLVAPGRFLRTRFAPGDLKPPWRWLRRGLARQEWLAGGV